MAKNSSRPSFVQRSLTLLLLIGLCLAAGIYPVSAMGTTVKPALQVSGDTATVAPTAEPPTAYPPPITDTAAPPTSTATTKPPPANTAQPTPSNTPPTTGFERPLLAVDSYSASEDVIRPGDQFDLSIKVANKGQGIANNVVAVFTPGELIPLGTGGMVTVGEIAPGNHGHIKQTLSASYDIYGKSFTSIDVSINYTDDNGVPFSDKLTITLPVYSPAGLWSTATPTPTPTSAPVLRPQLVISSYSADLAKLQPGVQFKLNLGLENLGNANAKRVTMILGGGSTTGNEASGTPGAGGTSGGAADLTNFAPIGSSNIQSLGDLPMGAKLAISQNLIVNVSTNPGAYSMKISFAYLDERGRNFTDDQVITLLVYSLPQVEIGFYRETGPLMVGQPTVLPLHVINMSHKSTILGNMQVAAENIQFTNNNLAIGPLDPGLDFVMDASMTPIQAGPLTLTVTVDYIDDFNQPQKISKNLQVEVAEAPAVEPGVEVPGKNGTAGEPLPATAETFLQKIWRLVRGLIGLDSGIATPSATGGNETSPTGAGNNPIQVPVPASRPLKGP